VGALVREAVASVTQGARSVTIAVPQDAEKASVFADRTLAHSALVAIIDNACRYSPETAAVRVIARIDGDRCLIVVEDEGPGIPAEDLPMVRERFWRGANSTAVPGAGTGLYMASTLLDANGGLLDIRSQTGVGTAVTVSLPLAQAMATELWEAA
jgi:signal transduction histidine kinase